MKKLNLSPKTQAVLDAYESATDKYKALAAPGFDPYNLSGRDSYYSYVMKNK